MGLTNSLVIGKSGLMASQAAIQVAGNNLANVNSKGYHRQTAHLTPAQSTEIQAGIFLGNGVLLSRVVREVDEALENRVRVAMGNESRSGAMEQMLGQLEAIQNEFTDIDLSTRLTTFFNVWSEASANPQDLSLRTLVAEESATLAEFFNDLRASYGSLQQQVDNDARNSVDTANNLLDRIAELNDRIAIQEHGTGGASGLRDQRAALLSELSEYFDISIVEQESGIVDVFVGSLPIVLGGDSRGVELRERSVNGEIQTQVVISDDKSPLDISSGKIGALVEFREGNLSDAMDAVDTLAGQIIWQVNRIHSQAQGLELRSSVTGNSTVADTSAALNSEEADLDFAPGHGSFIVHVTQKSTGQRESVVINVDLDGINTAGDTSLDSLTADLDAVANLNASITADGRLQLSGVTEDFLVSFSEDTSGVLASLGVNTFFTGDTAYDMAIDPTLRERPGLIAMAHDHLRGDNTAGLEITGLRSTNLNELDGLSITQYWQRHVEDLAIARNDAREQVEADGVVRENLEAQQQARSGVNADEETINLLQFQRAFQASARFISVVDELLQTLISTV